MTSRTSDFSISPIFLERWSPRAFDSSTLPEHDILALIEAARWAPSAFNIQPWRFAYSLRNDDHWQTFLSLLDPFNASWAQNASALIFLISKRHEEETPDKISLVHQFDAGAAWAQLALQAHISGFQAHAMAGIDHATARKALKVPANYDVQIAIAVGQQADASTLPENLRPREMPSQRLPLQEIATSGNFAHD